MRAYSLDLRTRVVEALDRRVGTQQAVATLFGVSCTFIKKLLRQRRETGTLAPKPHGGGQVAKLKEEQRQRVQAYILRTRNDATVSEVHTYVVTALGQKVSRATVGRMLQKLDLPRKKNASGQRARCGETRGVSHPRGLVGKCAVNLC
jgi:transposase